MIRIPHFANVVVDSAGAAISELGGDAQTTDVAKEARFAFSDAARYSAYSAVGFLTLGWFATLSLGERKPTRSRDLQPSALE